jgi:type I restriction enzyme M protein
VLQPFPSAKIVDPACGTGGFLAETHTFQIRNNNGRDSLGRLIGIDKDRDLARLAEAILEITAPQRSIVLNMNSLDLKALAQLPKEITPLEADFVMTNPPFGAKIKITDKSILKQYVLGHKWIQHKDNWAQISSLREAQDPQILFLELCIRLLKPGGQMGIVLPEGVFGNYNSGYIWDYVRSQGRITALIDCPRTTFQPGTDTKTNVLFFRKFDTLKSEERSPHVWTAVALNCGHDRRGRSVMTTGKPYPDDFSKIAESYRGRESDNGVWQLCQIKEPYYLVPRYYDSAPIQELSQEAERLGAKRSITDILGGDGLKWFLSH